MSKLAHVAKVKTENEELEFDQSAYILYHQAETGYPCLSFQIIPDNLGSGQNRLNQNVHTLYMVAGTQGPKTNLSSLFVIKMKNLTAFKRKNKYRKNKGQNKSLNEEQLSFDKDISNSDSDDDEDDNDNDNDENDDDDDDDDDDDNDNEDSDTSENQKLFVKFKPIMEWIQVPHNGCVNRVRLTTINNAPIVATWSDLGNVHIWNLKQLYTALDDKELKGQFNASNRNYTPIYSFTGHQSEGFAMDWSPVSIGMFATGDCKKNIHIWKLLESMSWHVDQRPLAGHTDSVEDIQWSPTESSVLASCSVDKSIKIWDTRTSSSSACIISIDNSHDSDVNVISWNKLETYFILSGGDDGVIKTWDLRKFADKNKKGKHIAYFKHHLAPITSIEWHPSDSTVFGASAEDNQITLWDLAVEKDEDEEIEDQELANLPPQLLFIHQGQKEIKELHWHPQIPGLIVSTAFTGFDIFKTISV